MGKHIDRRNGNTYPCLSGLQHGHGRIKYHHTVRWRRGVLAGRLHPRGPLVASVGAQQRKPEDVGRTVQTGGDIGRTQRRERRMTKKFSLGAMPRPATVADRIVKPFGSRINAVVMGGKLKIDVRLATAKIVQL